VFTISKLVTVAWCLQFSKLVTYNFQLVTVEIVQFPMKLLLKQIILAVHYDFD